jgi:hypothetical protein
MKNTDKNALEILAQHKGIVLSSEWVRGSGRYVSRRPVPTGCVERETWQGDRGLSEPSRKLYNDFVKSHPRAKKVILIVDWEYVEALAQKQ